MAGILCVETSSCSTRASSVVVRRAHWPVGELLRAGAEDVPDPVERVVAVTAVPEGLLLDPPADLVHDGGAELAGTVARHVGDPLVGSELPPGDEERLQAVSNLLAGHRPGSAPVEAHPGLGRQFHSRRRRLGVGAWRRLRWDVETARTRRPGA